MPSTLNPPNLSFHILTEYTNASDGTEGENLDTLNYGTYDVNDSQVISSSFRLRIKNEADCATAISPICYISGLDAEKIGTEGWVYMKNISNNGVSSSDEYSVIRNSPLENYKSLAGNIEGDTYITEDTYIQIPGETPAGRYSWNYRIEYQYTT